MSNHSTSCTRNGERRAHEPNTEPKEKKEAAFSLSREERLAVARRLGMTPGSVAWRDYVEG
jgi:hypothetical protein